MLLTVTPNPCIERTVSLPNFALGQSHRVPANHVLTTVGGKGINCARAAASLGTSVVALAFAGGAQQDWMRRQMESDGITPDLIAVASQTRTCLNVLHEGGNTEIVEEGESLEIASGTELLRRFVHHLPGASLVAICGSYPASRDEAWQLHGALLCHVAAQSGKRVIYDGNGAAFARALDAQSPPWMIKPNLKEAEAALGRSLQSRGDEIKAVRDFMRRGIEVVLMSCGQRGAYLGHPGGIDWIAAPAVATISPVGSGDAMLGAFCAALHTGANFREAGRQAVAAGAVNAASARPACITRAEIDELLPRVRLQSCEFTLQPR